jgi:methionyl-tRNA formyltransferase
LTIWRAQPIKSTALDALPGEVITARADDLIVNCGEQTALRLLEVQAEARKRMPVRDFINGLHVKVGDRFGKV